MRLLHTTKLQLEYFNGVPPPYAILSHTWGDEEVTFDDFSRNKDFRSLKGWSKISCSAELASREGFEYIWIDTCCIDKSSSAELSEAINSMFQWYKQSAICYAFLADVLASPTDPSEQRHDLLIASRWFTRGWTLQELIAPAKVDFYDKLWQFIGSKSARQSDFQLILARCSGVPLTTLQGRDLAQISVAQRMSWASKRQTTRREDLAYCLMGIFGIHMPLLYGEGDHAFMRLQEEILKTTDDETLFAWRLPKTSDKAHDTPFSGLLAPSPACFLGSGNIVSNSWRSSLPSIPTTISKQGVQMEAKLSRLPADKSESVYWAFLSCAASLDRNDFHLILLQRLSEGEPRFIRARPDIMATLGKRHADGRISIILGRTDDFQVSQLAFLCHPIPDPETQPIFVARNPPPAKLHYPIRFSVRGDETNLPEFGFETEAVACYDGDLKLKRIFSWPSQVSSTKSPTSFRLFYDSEPQPIKLDNQPIILAICKFRTTVSHFGIMGVESSASNTHLGLIIGLSDPPVNPCLTPPTYRIPWYSFTTWPGIDNGELGEFPTPPEIISLIRSAMAPRRSHVMLSSPQETPVKCLGLSFQRTLRRSTSDYNATFELKGMSPIDTLAVSNETSTRSRNPPFSAAMPFANADLEIQPPFPKSRLDADTAQQLYSSILDHWTVLIHQQTWFLRTRSADLVVQPVSPSVPPAAARRFPDEDVILTDIAMPIRQSGGPGSTVNTKVIKVSEGEKWDLVRPLLKDECDRFRGWKSNFSETDLNQIANFQSGLLGNLILESLVRIADALVELTNLGNDPDSLLFRGAKILDGLVREGRVRLKEFDRDDRATMESDERTTMGSVVVMNPYGHFVGDEILWRLRDENNRLERLIYRALLEFEFSGSCSGNAGVVASNLP